MARNFKSLSFVASQAAEAQDARNELVSIYGNADAEEADVIVALGGDGFMLQTLHTTMNTGKQVYGMNRGSVGFLMNRYEVKDLAERIEGAVENVFRPLEMVTGDASGQERRALAINEVYLFRHPTRRRSCASASTGACGWRNSSVTACFWRRLPVRRPKTFPPMARSCRSKRPFWRLLPSALSGRAAGAGRCCRAR